MDVPKIVSVDDHVVEPSHVWQTYLLKVLRGNAIRMLELDRV